MRAGDSPIESPDEDLLGRADLAARFAKQLASMDASSGLVVGVLGPWGSGKTSFVNLTRSSLAAAGVAIIDFNPWMFSGAEQLVDRFFIEVGEELKLRPGLAEIGEQFEQYGEIFSGLGWLPLAGAWIERGRAMSKAVAKAMQRRRQGSRTRRERLSTALSQQERPIVVILDDIDRLTSGEIREIFKLIRLTASFPQVVYLLAFDRARVEHALDEDGVPGRAYLEKILQLAVDLPGVPDQVLQGVLLTAIQRSAGDAHGDGPFDAQAWPDTFTEVIWPLISTMRDVRRYEAAIAITIPSLGGQVDLGDALALDAVRVFVPDAFAKIASGIDGLTSTAEFGYGLREPPELKQQVQAIVSADETRAEVMRSLVRRLFPAGARHVDNGGGYSSSWNAQWLRGRRIANRDVLRLFLERTVGEELDAYLQAERAYALADDAQRLTEHLLGIPADRREDVIRAMTNFSDRFDEDTAEPLLVALLNVLPTLPDRQRGMFDLEARYAVARLTYLTLSRLDSEQVADITRRVLPQIKSLRGRFELITSVGHRENAGHELVAAEVASQLEADWRKQLRDTPPSELAREKPLLALLWRAKHEVDNGEPAPNVSPSVEMTSALLRSAVSGARSQAMGNRAVLVEQRLSWDMLIDVVGGEDQLRAWLEPLRDLEDQDLRSILALCDRYLDGWRPDRTDA